MDASARPLEIGTVGQPAEQNLHLHRVQLVPDDLLDAIDGRAAKDGQSPELS